MSVVRSAVAAALEAVGSHRWVRIEVTGVTVLGGSVEIDLIILPDAVGHALGGGSPSVTIRAQLRHDRHQGRLRDVLR